jgi:MFS family permease
MESTKEAPKSSALPAGDKVSSHEDGGTPQAVAEQNTVTYLGGFKLAAILTALCLANFLVALDTTILSTAIPAISDEFRSLPDVGWYISSYLLTNCAFQLLYGKLYTLFDVKMTFLAAMIIFEIGSLICALAPNSAVFIFARAVAGLGGAGIFSGGTFLHPLSASSRAKRRLQRLSQLSMRSNRRNAPGTRA